MQVLLPPNHHFDLCGYFHTILFCKDIRTFWALLVSLPQIFICLSKFCIIEFLSWSQQSKPFKDALICDSLTSWKTVLLVVEWKKSSRGLRLKLRWVRPAFHVASCPPSVVWPLWQMCPQPDDQPLSCLRHREMQSLGGLTGLYPSDKS